MKKLCGIAALSMLLVPGCARFSVVQKDISSNERAITTTIKATAWFSSAQTITQIKALTTDKTQSFGAGNLAQQGDTNVIAALNSVVQILQLVRPLP